MFSALLIEKSDAEQHIRLTQMNDEQLPDGDVTVEVEFSTLNYKDALAITGASAVVRKFPMIPGIDFAGRVAESTNSNWKVGDDVILNGWGVGETHWGGLATRARVKGEWLIRRPIGLTARQSMAIGTAGYTSSLCVEALVGRGVHPDQGEVLVTGASGGVGSFTVALLSRAGFRVAASTGKVSESAYLRRLGASAIIDRDELTSPGKPLQKERWAAVIDCVGSHTLANACSQTRYGGYVAACGLAQGMDFPSSVAPFILRAVSLLGIDSVYAPTARRINAWARLARDLDDAVFEDIAREIVLDDVPAIAKDLMSGLIRGRIVVDTKAISK